jgi:hypothetical protein
MIDGLASGSYWTSSFLTDTNSNQYLLISHINTVGAYFRGGLLDMTESKYTPFFNHTPFSADPSSTFNVTVNDGGMQSTSLNNVSMIQMWSTNVNVQYNLTFEATSAVLYDGGAGQYIFGTGLTSEWALAACKTSGTLQVNGSPVTIDSSRSLTWYDRQFGPGIAIGNWTWFELHLGPDSNTMVSLAAWDSREPVIGQVRFATIRAPNGDHSVVPVTVVPSFKRTFVSSATNTTYPLDWDIISPLGETLSVSSFTADQEIIGPAIIETAYEGFVTTKGEFMGTHGNGFGLVEMVRTIE